MTAESGSDRSMMVRRFFFVANAPDGRPVRREFAQPRRMVAVEVAPDQAEHPQPGSDGPTDQFEVAVIPPGGDGDLSRQVQSASATIKLKNGTIIEWRPGRAIIRGSAEDADELLGALIDFAFFERERLVLEEIVESREDQALDDVVRSQRISRSERSHWGRIAETTELLARSRLIFARLEAMSVEGTRDLSPAGRRLLSQLVDETDAEARLESLSGRLEALEDLYEGANDRVADFLGWHKGHVLELVIIGLLLIETILMSGEFYLRYRESQQEDSAIEAPADEVKSAR